jgi:hypothetical protein
MGVVITCTWCNACEKLYQEPKLFKCRCCGNKNYKIGRYKVKSKKQHL